MSKSANWNLLEKYIGREIRPANGGDYTGAGCKNIARAIIYGLTYIGDCIKDIKEKEKSE